MMNSFVRTLTLCVILLSAGCQSNQTEDSQGVSALEWRLVLLTRDGCAATPAMASNLEGALESLEYDGGFTVRDMAQFDSMDPRRGYGSPTILLDGDDLFGLAEPGGGVAYAPT